MTITLSVTGVTATSATFGFANYGANGTIELQISTSRDFSFCVSPIYPGIARAAARTWLGLNQRTTYHAQARTRLNDGTAERWSNIVTLRTSDGAAQPSNGEILVTPAMIVTQDAVNIRESGSSPPIAGYPGSNLGVDAPVAAMLSPFDVGGQFGYAILFETGGAPVDAIALLNTNMPEDTTWALTGTSASDFTGQVLVQDYAPFRASPNLPQRNGFHGLMRLPAPTTYPYLALYLKSPTASILYAEHLIAGLARVSKNLANESTETSLPLGSVERRRSGMPDRQNGLPMRRVEFDLAAVSETQYETLYRDLIYRQNEAVLVVPNSKAGPYLHDRIFFGDLSGGRVVKQNSNVFTRSFTVDSLI